MALTFPPESLFKPRLSRLLLDQLQRRKGTWEQRTEGKANLLAWVVMLRGIAAFSTDMRDDFLQLMWGSGVTARYERWNNLCELARTFLSWDFVCESPGRTMWDEAIAMAGCSQGKEFVTIHRTRVV